MQGIEGKSKENFVFFKIQIGAFCPLIIQSTVFNEGLAKDSDLLAGKRGNPGICGLTEHFSSSDSHVVAIPGVDLRLKVGKCGKMDFESTLKLFNN